MKLFLIIVAVFFLLLEFAAYESRGQEQYVFEVSTNAGKTWTAASPTNTVGPTIWARLHELNAPGATVLAGGIISNSGTTYLSSSGSLVIDAVPMSAATKSNFMLLKGKSVGNVLVIQ